MYEMVLSYKTKSCTGLVPRYFLVGNSATQWFQTLSDMAGNVSQ